MSYFTLRIIVILMETIKDLDNQNGSDGLNPETAGDNATGPQTTCSSCADAQAIFCRRRHQPRRPAKISPGRPASAMGPGTGDATRSEVLKAQVLRASVQKPVAPAATWLRTKPWRDPVPQGRKLVLYAATLHDPKSMMKDATVSPEKVYEPGHMS